MPGRHRVSVMTFALAGLVALGMPARPPAAEAGVGPTLPVLSEPPAGRGQPLWDSFFDLTEFGYTEAEFFVSGTAESAGGDTADYTTRIIVTRPVDPADFNGTVVLDWVNVTAQFENPVTSILTREMMLREGWAFVHVSAQEVGLCCTPLTPKIWDPIRYAPIDHPGDEFVEDLFTQVAASFGHPPSGGSIDPMGDLGHASVERVIAAGQSQSAIRLRDYINGWLPDHPEQVGLIDGFLIHGNVFQPKTYDVPVPVPVVNLLSDLEAADDGVDPASDLDPNVRLWEIAGSAHSDYWLGQSQVNGSGPRSGGRPKVDRAGYEAVVEAAGNYGAVVTPELAQCFLGGTAFPMRYPASTALHQLDAWVAGGEPPAHGPRYEFAGGQLARDDDGNALGGIRLAPVDVPVASYRSVECQLAGITVPFTDLELVDRYGDHATYLSMMADHTDMSVRDGWLLPPDAADLMRRACNAAPRFGASPDDCPPYDPPPFRSTAGENPPAADDTAATDPIGQATATRTPTPRLPATGAAIPLVAGLAAAATALALRRGARGHRR